MHPLVLDPVKQESEPAHDPLVQDRVEGVFAKRLPARRGKVRLEKFGRQNSGGWLAWQ
jgi:hypothetical protein